MQEDVVDILLNLKGIVLKLHNGSETTLHLNKSGEGAVTAGDIEVTHDVEIINPEHVIAHLAPGGKLEISIKVERGRGYEMNTNRCRHEDGAARNSRRQAGRRRHCEKLTHGFPAVNLGIGHVIENLDGHQGYECK